MGIIAILKRAGLATMHPIVIDLVTTKQKPSRDRGVVISLEEWKTKKALKAEEEKRRERETNDKEPPPPFPEPTSA